MVMYLGGKTRIARHIVPHLVGHQRHRYVEPFLGGAAIAALVAPYYDEVVLADVMPDLVMLWQAAADGWAPPETLTEAEYQALRDAEPSSLRAFAGFPCSFGGKWFGGYARDPRSDRNYARTASRSVVRRAAPLAGATILRADYADLERHVDEDAVVYCDPPYAGTTTYGATDSFDSEAFWDRMRAWSARGALVYVSEYTAPDDWEPVWELATRGSLNGRGLVTPITERLYRPKE